MWPYWVMFLVPALAALHTNVSIEIAKDRTQRVLANIAWLYVWILLTLSIGYRFRVGGDWDHYLKHMLDLIGLSLIEVLTLSDPSYKLLNWLSNELDWGIYGVNLVGGAIFAFGLVKFCRNQPRPWLALAVAIPYMVIVVAMGYSRQGIALGLTMPGLIALRDGSTRGFAVWVALAATFHKSAVVLLPIAALASARSRLWTAVWVALTSAVLFSLLLANDADSMYENYVTAGMQSEGALVRLLMSALPAVILLRWRRRFQLAESEARLWRCLAIVSLLLLGLLMTTPASTAIDRIALYVLPLQLVVFAHFPEVFSAGGKRYEAQKISDIPRGANANLSFPKKDARVLIVCVLLYYAAALFVWLNYAANAYAWVPYRLYLLQ